MKKMFHNALSSFRKTLPVGDLGKVSKMTIPPLSCLYFASLPLRNSWMDSAVTSLELVTMKALGTSPAAGSGTPITATSVTPGASLGKKSIFPKKWNNYSAKIGHPF